ncbi:MAG: glycosyltransferase family 2 protein, partial [Candidatus Falkowbacteria bacterium]|nr:glycosyltransferase family 2 protein [Candidatus Falkowbacteria bacterium]
MNKKVAIILVNYLDYAERFLDECLAGLRAQDYQGEMKIFLVDNGSTDKSFNYLLKKVPEAEFVLNKSNDGFARGNNDGMKMALAQGFDYIFLLNEDTVIEQNCISELVKVFENENWIPDQVRDDNPLAGSGRVIGAVQARIMLHPQTNKINSLGNTTHFLGFGYCESYGQTLSLRAERSNLESNAQNTGLPRSAAADLAMTVKDICYPSGAAVMFRASVLKKIGLFDEEFWMYNEDQDLGWRVWLAGFRCVLAPQAIVYHKYEFNRSIKKYYWMDRNRIIAIIKNYHWATLLLILPAFLVMELGLVLFSARSGWFKEKIKVWQYFLNPANWVYLHRARQETQALRQVQDRDIIPMISGEIWYQEIDDIKLRIVNPV